ncbi:MAG: error-prone DNA polymerase, partial [Myxococcota bacterium]|nr:error-prone DNA polymerase [Myxococcota bacterium]
MSAHPSDYVELRACSAFSFLEGTANPEDLAARAACQGHAALALADRDGVYGIPRFYRAAQAHGLRPILGARVRLRDGFPLLLLVESRRGWQNLCQLLSLGHADSAKGKALVCWDQVEERAAGLVALVRGDNQITPERLDRCLGVFRNARLRVDVSRNRDRATAWATRRAVDMAREARVRVIATGDVRCALPEERRLLDALTCLRKKTSLVEAGRRLLINGECSLASPETIVERFADQPEWIRETRAVAERCEFELEDLGYRFPRYPVPGGSSQASWLRSLTRSGAEGRYGSPLTKRVRTQLEHELALIEKLDLAGYFLIVHDIVRFARSEDMLVQGRGSAANSAVCYALGITAVDPVGMDLLFERFLSEERGEWPDIDIDLPSGERRERVIQYVFEKYGHHGAAMTANVITYRTRMAVREMGKVLGQEPATIARLAGLLTRREEPARDSQTTREALRRGGIDPAVPVISHWLDLVDRIEGLPRHLGQHSGGVVIAGGRLDRVVPIEPARMEGRRVVQWDKDDCSDLGIIKIDLLGLGMLAALEETIPLIRRHEGVEIDLAHLPPDDPPTYAMIQRADTMGTFQIESRAQMATLPRLRPECFYDLVVEIAIIRPGPIVGKMVHPYLNRRAGREPVTYPHPSLKPILERTLGVPLFQEQLLRIAMTVAGFSGGEAEELRRAMGFKRSRKRMERLEERLREGMTQKGVEREAQEQIIHQIQSFALYGFPESHSASFALIAYASAYLKCHHPAAFLTGLLNAWPMGFYHPASLIQDALRHGVTIHPIDVTRSFWRCTLEPEGLRPAIRLGLRYAGRLRENTAATIVKERRLRPFTSLADFSARSEPHRDELDTLAELGSLGNLPGGPQKRREALWQVAALERDARSLFAGAEPPDPASPLEEMTEPETTLADYRLAGITTGPHFLAHLRPSLRKRGFLSAKQIQNVPNGRAVQMAA